MYLIVKKTSTLSGTVMMPGSKSQTIRAVILASLAQGESVIRKPLVCEDVDSAVEVMRQLGARISPSTRPPLADSLPSARAQGEGRVSSSGGTLEGNKNIIINTGNSGITTRFALPLAGLVDGETVFDCGEQMKKRPIMPLVEALRNLGLRIETNGKKVWPIKVSGRLKGGKTKVDGTSSQYISALLLSAPLASGDTEIIVENLQEKPYVQMTCEWLDRLGIKYEHENFEKFKIKGGQKYGGFEYTVPGDFSSASYFLAAGCLLGERVAVGGLEMGDAQGDKRFISVLREMNADTRIQNSLLVLRSRNRGREYRIRANKKAKKQESNHDEEAENIIIVQKCTMHGGIFDLNDMPDMVPTLAVLGCAAKGKTIIKNVAQARIKESDRLAAMAKELKKMGAKIEERADGLVVEQSELHGARVNGHNDHRVIMALSVAGMIAEGETVISGAEGVDKTFPGFVTLMRGLGADMRLSNILSGFSGYE